MIVLPTPSYRIAFCALALMLLILPCAAAEADIEPLIEKFESSNDKITVANRLFAEFAAIEFTDEQISFAADTPLDSVSASVFYWAGEWYNDKQDYKRALDYGCRALSLFKYNNQDRAYCLNLLGVVCVRLGDFTSGANYTKQCVDIDLLSGDANRIALSMSTLAGTYLAANQPNDAIKYALSGLEYAKSATNTLRATILMGMASEANYKLGNFEKAIEYADDAFRLDSVAERWPRAAIRLSQKANALAGLKRFAEAEATFKRAFPMLEQAGNIHSLGIDYNQLGMILVEQGRCEEAIDYFRKASAIFHNTGDLYNQIHSQRGLYESYWKIDADSARKALNTFNALKDSLYSQATADALARYNAEFDTDRLKEQVASHGRIQRRSIIVAVALILVLSALAVVFYRCRIRRYRTEMQRLMQQIGQISIAEPIEETVESAEVISLERQVIDAVHQGMAIGQCSVAQIAKSLNMGEQTFRRRFIEATGKQPKSFISAIQMEYAAELLKSDAFASVGDVAHRCGYDDISAFSHSFKRTFGCSPSEFRKV